MAELTFVCLYRSYMDDLEPYSMAQRGRLITAMMRYFFEGEEPSFRGPERYIWPILRSQCDRDQEKYQKICRKNAQNARKRWEQEGYGRMPPHESAYQMDAKYAKENESENENKSENESENKNENNIPSGECSLVGEPVVEGEIKEHELVGVEEISRFCMQEGLTLVDPEKFYNYYSAGGWMIGNKPMKDWKAAVRLWENTERKERKHDRSSASSYCGGATEADRAYDSLFL